MVRNVGGDCGVVMTGIMEREVVMWWKIKICCVLLNVCVFV